MTNLEERLKQAVSSIRGNEALAEALDGDSADTLLEWGHSMAVHIVNKTGGLDDDAADGIISPRLRALRLMMRAVSRWVGEASTLSAEDRDALWNRIADQGKTVFGDDFKLPPMQDILKVLPENANAQQTIAWLMNHFEGQKSKG